MEVERWRAGPGGGEHGRDERVVEQGEVAEEVAARGVRGPDAVGGKARDGVGVVGGRQVVVFGVGGDGGQGAGDVKPACGGGAGGGEGNGDAGAVEEEGWFGFGGGRAVEVEEELEQGEGEVAASAVAC